MRTRFKYLFLTYFLFVLLFLVQKPVFMLYHRLLFREMTWRDWWQVSWHGLMQDLSVSAALTLIPAILLLITIWSRNRIWRRLAKFYFVFISLLIAVVYITDLAFFRSVGGHLGASQWLTFLHSPQSMFSDMNAWAVLGGGVGIVLMAIFVYALFYPMLRNDRFEKKLLPLNKPFFTLLFVLLIGVLILPVRQLASHDSLTTNRQDDFQNHPQLYQASLNPLHCMFGSTPTIAPCEEQPSSIPSYRFMDADEANKLAQRMLDPDVIHQQYHAPKFWILNTARPNILLLVLNGVDSQFMSSLGGMQDVMPQLDQLSSEGMLFRHFYASGTTSHEGISALLTSTPAIAVSHNESGQHAPSLVRELHKQGYSSAFLDGGAANIQQKEAYLSALGFQSVTTKAQFDKQQCAKKGGVYDQHLFRYFLDNLRQDKGVKPWLKVIQTAHLDESAAIPSQRLTNKKLNRYAYTDSCVGQFITELKQLPQWKEMLVVITSSHVGGNPTESNPLSTHRYHIPLLFLGGALKGPGNIDIYGSQTDLVATLCGQLGLSHQMFQYSKDMFNPNSPHFAFFTAPHTLGLLDEANQVTYDINREMVGVSQGNAKAAHLKAAQAYLQHICATFFPQSK